MNNFNNGRDINVNGNFVINDNSSNYIYKPINQCTKEELIEEYNHRQNLLREEIRNKKINSFKKAISLFIIMIVFLGFHFFYFGQKDLAQLVIAIGSFIAPVILYFSSIEVQTEFEKRQILIINEINHLYKERK